MQAQCSAPASSSRRNPGSAEQRADVGEARARRRARRCRRAERGDERARQRRPHRARNQRPAQPRTYGPSSAPTVSAADDVADGSPEPQPPVDGAGAHARDRQRVGQAAHPDEEDRVAERSRSAPARSCAPRARAPRQRREPQPGAEGDEAQHPIVALRSVGQPGPPERHRQRRAAARSPAPSRSARPRTPAPAGAPA